MLTQRASRAYHHLMAQRGRKSIEATPARWYAIYGTGYRTRRDMLRRIVAADREAPALFDYVGAADWFAHVKPLEARACAILILAGLARYDDSGSPATIRPTDDGIAVVSALDTHTPHRNALLRKASGVTKRRRTQVGADSGPRTA